MKSSTYGKRPSTISDPAVVEFLALLAHELRNPLTPITNAVEVMLRDRDPAKLDWGLRLIERQTAQLTRLVDDLHEVNRVVSGKITLRMEKLDVRSAVTGAIETVTPLIEARGQHLEVDLPGAPVFVNGDFARLTQIMVNLLTNAAKYTQEGGHILCRVKRHGARVTLSVNDDGIGISQEMMPKIFELFTQGDPSLERAQGGLGVGLSLVERFARMHEGKVQAKSAGPGQGAEFSVILPLADIKQLEAVTQHSGLTGVDAPKRIFIVDDNVDAADSLGLILTSWKHTVQCCYNAEQALAQAAAFQPDILLLDIGMPGICGYELARAARRMPELAQARLIAATGYGQKDDIDKARAAGFNYHLTKPIDLEMLRQVVQATGSPIPAA